MKRISSVLLSLTLVASFIGCATTVTTNIAMKSSLNEFLAISTKTNSDLPISCYFRSNVKDGEVVARNPDFRNVIMSHTEATDFKEMLDEYMGNKFSEIHPSAETKIIITLADFYLDRKMVESTASATMKLLAL